MGGTIDRVGVVGLGQMGAGIAEVFARSGLAVVGIEPTEDALDRGRGHLQRSTDRAVQRNRLSAEDQQAMLDRITFTTSMADAKDCGLVIEAVPEILDLKRAIFGELDRVCDQATILATNTSSLSVTQIAVATGRQSRVVGMHFFNPAPVMKLVEVVRTVVTDPAVVSDVVALAGRLGKTTVSITDRAGFVANALLFGYLNRAVTLHESGYVSRDDLDAAMDLGAGYPMGALALLDLIGLDTSYEILETLYARSRDRLHAPAPMLGHMVTAGLLGRKSGRGFYSYEAPGSGVVVADQGASSTSSRTTPDLEAAHDVRRVAVVGSGRRADALVATFAAAYDVRRLSEHDLDQWGRDPLPAALAELQSCDLVVDVGDDTLIAAQGRFGTFDGLAPHAVLATASRTHPVTECGAATSTGRPASVVGLHVHPAVRRGRLVEIVRGVDTSDATVATARGVARRLGAHVLVCGDRAGQVVHALLVPLLNDAVRMVEEGYASADDVDAAMRLGCGFPRGPIEMVDEFGLDAVLGVQRALHRERGEPGLAPALMLERLVTAGRLGGRWGRGIRERPAG